MKLNLAYIVMAAVLAALWGLRRLGMDDKTADAIVTALVMGLGFTPSPGHVKAKGGG